MKTIALSLTALAVLTGGAVATPKMAAKTAKTVPVVCPVTGTKIASAAKAYNKETYKGKTYYFCCPDCKPKFDKNPGKVIASAARGKYQPM